MAGNEIIGRLASQEENKGQNKNQHIIQWSMEALLCKDQCKSLVTKKWMAFVTTRYKQLRPAKLSAENLKNTFIMKSNNEKYPLKLKLWPRAF